MCSWFRRHRATPDPTQGAPLLSPEVMRSIQRLELRTRGFVESLFSGEHASIFHGRGMDFSHVRSYQPGDDVRAIDWKVTARRNAPYVRQFVEERDLPVVLLVDLSASGHFAPGERSPAELATEIAAALALAADRNNDRTALLLATDRVEFFLPLGSGRKHTLRLLGSLLSIEPRGRGTELGPALERISHAIGERATVVLISDFIQDPAAAGFRESLARVGRAHDLIALRLTSRGADELPDVGWVELVDPESGRRALVASGSRRARERYRTAVLRSRAEMTSLLTESGGELLDLAGEEDLFAELARFLLQRRRRS